MKSLYDIVNDIEKKVDGILTHLSACDTNDKEAMKSFIISAIEEVKELKQMIS